MKTQETFAKKRQKQTLKKTALSFSDVVTS